MTSQITAPTALTPWQEETMSLLYHMEVLPESHIPGHEAEFAAVVGRIEADGNRVTRLLYEGAIEYQIYIYDAPRPREQPGVNVFSPADLAGSPHGDGTDLTHW